MPKGSGNSVATPSHNAQRTSRVHFAFIKRLLTNKSHAEVKTTLRISPFPFPPVVLALVKCCPYYNNLTIPLPLASATATVAR